LPSGNAFRALPIGARRHGFTQRSFQRGASFDSKKTGEFSKGKLMGKNCMDAIFDTGPYNQG